MCSGAAFSDPSGKTMTQHVSSDKRKEKALAAWGAPNSIDSLQSAFGKMLSAGGLFPWADAGLPQATLKLSDKLQAMVKGGMLPINALPQVRATPPEHHE